jgi:RING finger protein 170
LSLPLMTSVLEGFGDDVLILFGGSVVISLVTTYIFAYKWAAGSDTHHTSETTETTPAVHTSPPTVAIAIPANVYGIDTEQCPICIDTFGETVVTTNCGHNFDLSCFMEYASHQLNPSRVSCPSCRQNVSLLFSNFDASTVEQTAHLNSFRRYNRINGHIPRSYYAMICDIPELMRQIVLDVQLSRQLLTTAKRIQLLLLLFGACLYLSSPFDLIPEAMFGILGYIDDLVIVILCFIYITSIFRDIYVFRYGNNML